VSRAISYLLFPSITLMAGDANLVEKAVQLANDFIDLLRQVTCIHVDCSIFESRYVVLKGLETLERCTGPL
jgi:hypothetical protein